MTAQVTCPGEQKLARYAQNELPQTEASVVDDHLSGCRSCLHRFLELGKRSQAPDIPGCHIVKEIGRGRFGVVYKAWSLGAAPKIVALKVLSFPGEMETSRFEREIAVLKRIDSPGIVKCIDAGSTNDARYFVMDFIEGTHLDEYLSARTTTLEEKLQVFQRVCRAVADAHGAGVVHRDLKPRNILIDDAGQPHVLDFGICTVEPKDWSSWLQGTITHAGDVIGTLRYMSPEQAWGGVAGPIDERSDIWALGIILYEIVTEGDYPYLLSGTPDQPVHEALLNRIRKELPMLPKLDYLPRGGDLEVLLERCLVWERGQRIQKVETLANDIDAYCAGRRITTRRVGPLHRAKRLAIGAATRSRFAFSASFVAAVGLLLWLAVMFLPIGWEVNGHWYQADGEQAALGTVAEARERIRIVGIHDETPAALAKYAAAHGLPAVTWAAPSWRPVHGAFMQRLAAVRPRAVVWDFYFTSSQPHDAHLVAGATALEDAGVPVSFAVRNYHENGEPELSPALTDKFGARLRHGAIVARDMVERPGEFVMVVKRQNLTVIPSLALTALGSVIMPESRVDLDWPARQERLYLLHRLRLGAYSRVRNEMRLTRAVVSELDTQMVRAGELLGFASFHLDKPDAWARRSVRYEEVLDLPDARLAELFADKIVVVGDFRTGTFGARADRHPVKYGTSIEPDIPGCLLLADAIAGLMGRRQMIWAMPPPPTTFLSMLGLAALATMLPIRLANARGCDRSAARRTVVMGLTFAGAVSFVAMASLETSWGVHLAMAGVAISFPMAGSFLVEFARNRHRIADRARREIETLRLSSDGTLTLAPPQPTSPIGA